MVGTNKHREGIVELRNSISIMSCKVSANFEASASGPKSRGLGGKNKKVTEGF